MNLHTLHRNSDNKSRKQKTTVKLPPWNGQKLITGGLNLFYGPNLTLSFRSGSKHSVGCSVRMLKLLLVNEYSRLTHKSQFNYMIKQRRVLNRYRQSKSFLDQSG